MTRKITKGLLSKVLPALMAFAAIPDTIAAETYKFTLNIDNVERVKTQTQKLVDNNYITEDITGLKSGENEIELDESYGVITFGPSSDAYNIVSAHISGPGGVDYYGRILGGVATIYTGTYMDGYTITVTSTAVTTATATINLDKVANLITFQNSSRDILPMKSGENKLTFNPVTDNPFLFMVKTEENADAFVTLNGNECQPKIAPDGYIYTVTLDDGDVVDINTGYTGGTSGDDDDTDYPDPNTLITELPAGGYPMEFAREAYSYRMTEDGLVHGKINNAAGELVFYPSGETYIKNPFTFIPNGAYLKGTNDQGVVVVKFPQKIYSREENGELTEYWAYRLDRVKGSDDAAPEYAIDPEVKQNIQFMGLGDGSWNMLITQGEDFILGACTEDGKWTGFGDTKIIYARMSDEAVTAPRGTSFSEYEFKDGGYSVYVGLKEDEIYLKGISKFSPDACIKGTIANGKAIFPSGQYVGSYMGWHNFFYGISNVDGTLTDANLAEELTMDFDAQNKVLKAGANTGFVINRGKETLNAIDAYVAPVFGNETESGIATAVAGGQDSSLLYDLKGQRVTAPVKGGVYIRRTTDANGIVKTEKAVY